MSDGEFTRAELEKLANMVREGLVRLDQRLDRSERRLHALDLRIGLIADTLTAIRVGLERTAGPVAGDEPADEEPIIDRLPPGTRRH